MNTKQLEDAIYASYPDAQGTPPELKIRCIKCGEQRYRLGINTVKQVGHCFNCGWRIGTAALSIMFPDSKFTENSFEALDDILNDKVAPVITETVSKIPLEIPAIQIELALQQDDTMQLAQEALEYLKKRGFELELAVAKRFMIGKPGSILQNRLVLPIMEAGEILSYQARTLRDAIPKYLNPPKIEGGCSKSALIYNVDCIKEYEHIVICEGIFSALSVGPFAVAIFGKDISQEQANKLRMGVVKQITLMLDPGAERSALRAADMLYTKFDVRVAMLEDGDPNELSPSEIEYYLESAKLYDQFYSIYY